MDSSKFWIGLFVAGLILLFIGTKIQGCVPEMWEEPLSEYMRYSRD